jgi:hypothetical protein
MVAASSVLAALPTGTVQAQGLSCSVCGPGDHWVDQCPLGGDDQIADFHAWVEVDLDLDPLCIPELHLFLPPCEDPLDTVVVRRSSPLDDSMHFPGLRPLDGHMDVIDTEIIEMCLTGEGVTIRAGAGGDGQRNLPPSLGAVAEIPGNAYEAEGFFEVFVEITIDDGPPLYNQMPIRAEASVDCMPPRAPYYLSTGCIPLYTAPVGGVHVANLSNMELYVNTGPDPRTSYVEWVDLVCQGTTALVCPAGDGTSLHAVIMDQYGIPMAGVPVDVAYSSACGTCVCEPSTVFTGTTGEAFIPIHAGLDVIDHPGGCVVTTDVECLGLSLPWADGHGRQGAAIDWLTPDVSGDCEVGLADFVIVEADVGTDHARSDYDCDGSVSLYDLSIFLFHFVAPGNRPDDPHACEPIVTGIEEGDDLEPRTAELRQNYPNPFNPLTHIVFSVSEPGRVTIRVYDISGRPVRTLVDAWRGTGDHEVSWDGRDNDGREVASGVYFYRLEVPGRPESRKMVLLR